MTLWGPWTPIRTPRLILRPPAPGDVDGLYVRRNDPAVARLEAWELPFPVERARAIVEGGIAMRGPIDGEWYLIVIDRADTGETVGDLALRPTWGGRSAEIGYTLHSEHWGSGYATESAASLVEYLFGHGDLTRISAMTHPDNVASARVLERLGFEYEGHTRLSFWVGDENSDDVLYGLTRQGWDAWRTRPLEAPEQVRLASVDPSNIEAVAALRTHKSQERLVAPMVVSFAEAIAPAPRDGVPVEPWMRAIEADGVVAGFMMVALPRGDWFEPFLWRLLIDRMQQRRRIGSRAVSALVDVGRRRGATALTATYGEGPGSPRSFYAHLGFEPTGRIVGGETEARLELN